MNKGELAAICMREINNARGNQDALAARRARYISLYKGETPEAPASAGRSAVVSLDVAEGIHALMAQLDPVIRTSLVQFDPMGAQDVGAAKQESEAVRRVLERSGGYAALASVVQDALLLANGWLYLKVIQEENIERMVLPDTIPPEALAGLPEDVEVEHGDSEVILSRRSMRDRLVIEAVPPEEMLYSSEDGFGPGQLDQLRFVARRRSYRVSDLLDMGIDRALIDATPNTLQDDLADGARSGLSADETAAQEANQLKDVTCCYLLVDEGDDGKGVERRQVWMGGENVLLDEPAAILPFVTGCAIPLAHTIDGTAVAGLLDSIQCAKTETLRQFLDNLAALNGSRLGVLDGQVNMGDLLNGRVNGVVRMATPNAILPLPSADIGPQAMSGLSYLDSVRSSRIGAALDATEVQAQLMSASATAAAGQLAKVELMSGWFASNLVETILKPLYLLAHRLLRDSSVVVMLKDQAGGWAEVSPRTWQARDVAEVTMGLTTMQRAQRQMALNGVLQQQQQALQMGEGVLVDKQRLYNAAVDWLTASDLPDPERYLINPASPESQQAAQAAGQAQQQAMQQQQQMLQQAQDQIHQFELEKQARDLDYKRWADLLNAEVEEAKLTQAGVSDVLKVREQSAQARRQADDAAREADAGRRERAQERREQATETEGGES